MDPRSSITPWDLECMLCNETIEPKALPLSLLEEITNGFSDEQIIGSGGFAVVYKGMLENMTVAVKRMSNTYMYEKEFQREVECLMMARHKNVVRFLGYCADTQGSMEKYEGKFVMADVQHRLLCFEYLPKGSLHDYITDTSHELRWRDRYQIITGICHGLHYLHQKNILHSDLKPANILLDDNWVPKITDFGISRCFDQMQSQVLTNIAGTPGYLAPESFNCNEITYRNSYQLDIYSLGVVILEILTGKKGYHDVAMVVESWSHMVEESQSEVQLEQVRVCAEIGIECTNFDPAKRPDTQHIISKLDETESMYGYIETGVITSQLICPDIFTGTMHAVWLSYQQLNPDIRRCIEYCNIFPKGFRLKKVQLVGMWIAQGFVKTSCAREYMEDVAEGYIQELVSCSFLQPIISTYVTTWLRIHDVLHDVLDTVGGKNFRIKNGSGLRGWVGDDPPRDIQHIFIQEYDGEWTIQKILRLENILTLIVYDIPWNIVIEEKVIESICKRLPKLRVLAFPLCQQENGSMYVNQLFIPESIFQLKHLRYFAFRRQASCTLILPRALNKLHHLQLLDFGDCKIREFNFGNLINLRNIFCSSAVKFPNIGRLISLQSLPNSFEIRNEQGYEVNQLRNLNKLRGVLVIRGLENVTSKEKALEANLAAKERLTKLYLHWHRDGRRCSQEVEAAVLEGLLPPTRLRELTITGYSGSRYPDWMTGKQNGSPKYLQFLFLEECKQPGPAQLVEAFPHLCLLSLRKCSWDGLPGNLVSLTSLKYMYIIECRNIRSLPTLPQSLEEFHIGDCDDGFMKSCLTVGDPNWQKIEHIHKKMVKGLSITSYVETKICYVINRLRGIWHCNTA